MYGMLQIYIYIYLYICNCICFERKRFHTEYMRSICENLESKPRIRLITDCGMFSSSGRPLLLHQVLFFIPPHIIIKSS